LPAIKNQIAEREAKKRVGGFVPEWKNLSTWLNQRCWEEEIISQMQTISTKSDPNKYINEMSL
jgi:hypothetical protein